MAVPSLEFPHMEQATTQKDKGAPQKGKEWRGRDLNPRSEELAPEASALDRSATSP